MDYSIFSIEIKIQFNIQRIKTLTKLFIINQKYLNKKVHFFPFGNLFIYIQSSCCKCFKLEFGKKNNFEQIHYNQGINQESFINFIYF